MKDNNLSIYYATPLFGNVAYGRKESSALELHEINLHKLTRGVSLFVFKTKDGEPRVAYGTLNPDNIRTTPDSLATQLRQALKVTYNVHTNQADNYERTEFLDNEVWISNTIDFMGKPKKPVGKKSENVQTYFDLERMQWRTYVKDNLLMVFDF